MIRVRFRFRDSTSARVLSLAPIAARCIGGGVTVRVRVGVSARARVGVKG